MSVTYQSQGFLTRPIQYLSLTDVETSLKSKRIILIKSKDYHCSFNKKWKTATLSLFGASIILAVTGFLFASLYGGHFDHMQDRVTIYQGRQYDGYRNGQYILNREDYLRYFSRYMPAENNMWVDHTKDTFLPNYTLGLQIFVPLATLPAVLLLIIWKVIYTVSNAPLLKNQKRIEDLNLSLQCTKRNSSKTKLKKRHISELIALDFFSNADASKLCFSQIKSIRKDHLSLFTSYLNENTLSETQNNYWKKILELLDAAEKELLRQLNNKTNLKMFEEEPRIVETLIQELKIEQMTTAVKQNLSNIIKLFNRELSRLETAEILEVVEAVHCDKCSLKEALRRLKAPLKVTCLLLFDVKTKSVSINADLLFSASKYFDRLLKDQLNDLETMEISIPAEDSEHFLTILEYLKTGTLNFNSDNCIPLLTVCNQYLFMALLQEIHVRLCHDLNDYLGAFGIKKLLKAADLFHLDALRNGIDEKIAQNPPSFFDIDFLKTMKMTLKYSLQNSLGIILDRLYKDMALFARDDRFSTQFLSLLKIDQIPFDEIFECFLNLLKNNPKLLKTVWDLASQNEMDAIMDRLVLFCKKKVNASIWLECWDLPPINDKFKFSRKALEKIELESIV